MRRRDIRGGGGEMGAKSPCHGDGLCDCIRKKNTFTDSFRMENIILAQQGFTVPKDRAW